MTKVSSTKGFTLTEVLVAMGLFAVVSTIAASVLVDVVQLQKKSSVQNEIYEDARILMQQLTNEIQSGTIDYEEYYSMNVVQQKKAVIGGSYYGINYGAYASRFFNPGKTQFPDKNNIAGNISKNPDNLGIECSYPSDLAKDCEIYFSDSSDLNTGQNPYKNNISSYAATDANALCDKDLGIPAIIKNSSGDAVNSCDLISNIVPELYLIDSSGTHKTILGLKKMTDTDNAVGMVKMTDTDNAVGMVKMTGQDLDQNGIVDVFSCDSDYKCTAADDTVYDISAAFKYPFIADCLSLGKCTNVKDYLLKNKIRIPRKADLLTAFDANTSQFVPITPTRANIEALTFTINPLDDPYKAYAEPNMQTQPTVTINMTIGLSSTAKGDYPGQFPDVTLQTTVTAGVIGKIDSYPPVNDVLRSNGDKSWIYNIFH